MRVMGQWAVGIFVTVSAACFQPPLERDTDEAVDTSTETDGVDAEIGPDSVTSLVPSELAASVERVDDVELSWSGGALAFWVYRCDGAPCGGEWRRLTSEPIVERKFRDTTALAAGSPRAPTLRVMEDSRHVDLSWDAVVAPSAPRYSYRVTAVVEGVESAPSSEAMGHRAERPVTGYEVSVAQGEWEDVGVTTWRDVAAGPPTLSLSGVVASQGTYAAHVELVASGVNATAGPTKSYRVRAVTDFGPGAAAEASGRRRAPTVALQWQRSELEAEGFEDLPLATTAVAQDTGAPVDGSARYYRVVLSGIGAQSVSSKVVAGWRQPPPGVPGGLTATTELGDRVRLSWQAVSGALGYHVYRGAERLTSGSGIEATSFEDFDTGAPGEWAAPGSVSASTDRTEGIEVSWVAPARPVGASASYSVSAVNPSGEGTRSASVSGRRSAPALDVWEVEVTSDGGTRVEQVEASEPSWFDEDAPRAEISPGAATASQGDHRAYVRLSSSGAVVTPAATVSYRMRGRLDGGGGTPWSAFAEGRRAHGGLSNRWQRSTGTTAQSFADLGSGLTMNDSTAPSDGALRWYRNIWSAPGAESAMTSAVEGWRLAFVEIAAGYEFTCARTTAIPDGGRVWCWGRNTSGQLGRGHMNIGPSPERIPSLSGVRELAAGANSYHVCARKDDATVWCWGSNQSGTIGDGTTQNRPSPTQVPGLSSQSVRVSGAKTCSRYLGRVHCWGDGLYGDIGSNQPPDSGASYTRPAPVHTTSGAELSRITHLAAGGQHGCATSSEDQLWCWGYNDGYQLGTTLQGTSLAVNTRELSIVALYAGCYVNCARSSSGQVSCWGSNYLGALGQPTEVWRSAEPLEIPSLIASDLSLGGDFGCAVVSEEGQARAKCWGAGNYGQLGIGSTTNTHVPQTVLLSPGNTPLAGVHDIAAGSNHGCALVNNAPYCWGGSPATSTRAAQVTLP